MSLENPSVENTEQNIVDNLNSLGISFEFEKDNLSFKFLNVQRVDRGSFWLNAGNKKILLQCVHFDDNKFKDLNKNKISADDLFKQISEKFPDAEQIIYSCCYPDNARRVLENSENEPLIVGSNSSEYNTIYNPSDNSVTVLPAK